MSAWMVSDAHLDLLATAYVAFVDPDADPQALGQQLARDCAASIRARYEDRHGCAAEAEEQAEKYVYRRWIGNIDPLMLAKQVACYAYQSCETEDWPQRPSFAATERLNGRLLAMGADYERQDTDDYPWGVDYHPEDREAPEPQPEAARFVLHGSGRLPFTFH